VTLQAHAVTAGSTSGAPGASEADPAQASSDASNQELSEVVVTAQRRAQKASDVPISLVVLSSEQLQQLDITSPEDLQFAVPGLTIQGGGAQRRITLRGVSNVYGNGASVGEYVDEADVTSGSQAAAGGYGEVDTGMYDLDRIEVLRGPQGTLFGVGAIGGVIRYITNKPVLDQYQMTADGTALFTEDGAPGERLGIMLNTPLISDTLGLRFAGQFDHEGGWLDEPAADLKNINGQDIVDARIEGLWEPTSQLTVAATQIIHRNAYGMGTGEDANGNYTQAFDLTTEPHGQESLNLSNLDVTYDFGGVKLLSSSTYWTHGQAELDAGNTLYDLGGLVQYVPDYSVDETNFSQDLRLARSQSGPWQWTLGGFYKDFRDTQAFPDGYDFGSPGPLTSDDGPFLSPYTEYDASKSWSAYGDTSYKLFDRLTVGAGARYFEDRETTVATGTPFDQANFSSTDPRFYVEYQVTPNVNTYASAAKGFREGGLNGFGLPPFGPESVWTYELGTKVQLFDRRVLADTDVFYSNYQDYTVQGFAPGTTFNIFHNVGTARIKGVEEDLTWRAGADWLIRLNGDYLTTKFVAINVTGSAYSVGEPLDLVAPYSFAGSVEREFRVSNRPAYVIVNYSQIGRQRYAGTPGYLGLSDVIHQLELSAGIEWKENLTLGLFAKNLLNDRGYLNPFNTESASDRPRPRTFGIEFHFKD
jgi:outer membrane receptor protein involved in Fe transport